VAVKQVVAERRRRGEGAGGNRMMPEGVGGGGNLRILPGGEGVSSSSMRGSCLRMRGCVMIRYRLMGIVEMAVL
jgi:hypothetical protein